MHFRPAALLALLAAAAILSACLATEEDRKSLAQGYASYDSRRLDDAEGRADAFIRKNPDAENLDEAYYLRGLARYSKGSRPAAAQDFLTAIDKSKRNDLRAKAYGLLAEMAYDGQRWEQALDYFNKALPFYPEGQAPAAMYYRIAATLQNLGLWDKARPFLDVTIALKPEPFLLQHAILRRSATSFSLQFGAFKDGPNASQLLTQLKSGGISAVITTEMREGQLLYLVRSGTYRNYAEADFARQKLQARFPLLTIVP